MSLADQLAQIEAMHAKGALNDDEFARAKARLLDGGPVVPPPGVAAVNRLRRVVSGDRWIAGVCGGLAVATGAESWVWRLIFVALFLFGGTGLLLYVLLWIFVPTE